MTKNTLTLVQIATQEEAQVYDSIYAVSPQWLADETGILIDRVRLIRNGRGKATWAEIQAIRRAIRNLSDQHKD